MKKKLQDSGGLTLVEMLCAVAILVMLSLLLNTGLNMAMHAYRTMIAQSEVELLLSTLSDKLADDLRYAQDVKPEGGGPLVSYSGGSFAGQQTVSLSLQDGRVMANGLRVLPEGVYGHGAYVVETMDITYSVNGGVGSFDVKLKVRQADGTIAAGTEFSVRCLNGAKTSGGGAGP